MFLSDKQHPTRPAFLDIDWDAMETATDLFPLSNGSGLPNMFVVSLESAP
jgi:hypothetical protein